MIKWNFVFFVTFLILSLNAQALTDQGKDFIKSLRKQNMTDQVSELVTWLSQSGRAEQDRQFLGYYTANMALNIGNFKVAEQFFYELSRESDLFSALSKVKLALLYCEQKITSNSCEGFIKELYRDPKIKNSKELLWTIFEQEVLYLFSIGNWARAESVISQKAKKFRSPQQLERIAEWEIKIFQGLNKLEKLCEAEKKLFVNYPNSPLAKSFSEIIKTCKVSVDEKRKRIKKMILLGNYTHLETEISILSGYSGFKAEEFQIILADYHLKKGDTTKAILILEALIKDGEQTSIPVLNLYASALSRAQRFLEASEAYNKIKALTPRQSEKAQAAFDSAFVLYQGALYPQAREGFKKYLAQFRKGVHAQEAKWYLGWLSFLSRDFENARIEFEKLILSRRYSEKTKVFYWLAKVYWQLNFRQEATDVMTAISNQKMKIYNFYTNKAIQWLVQNTPTPSLVSALKDQEDCVQASCAHLLNVDQKFIVQVPSTAKLLEYFDMQGSSKISELPSSENKIKAEYLPLDLHTISDSKASVGEFAHRIRLVQDLFEIEESELAISELKSLYYLSSLPEQKLPILKLLEKYRMYEDAARLAELYLQSNPKVDRQPWIALAFPKAYSGNVAMYSKKFGVEESFIFSIIRAESFFNPRAESPVHARGLMQLMPFTANQVSKSLGVEALDQMDKLFDPETNIKLGSAYLARLLRQFDQNYILAAAGYNAGPHRVQTWLSQFGFHDQDVFVEHIPFKETRGYVKKVMGFMDHYSKSASLIGPINVREVMRVPASKERWDDI